ncbi:ABC transporter permease [Demequina lutea]|uniref:ABC-type proline/glycine betaine transport system permease subunit n=1 Tax=Demequina lutea TaxID=431489 RepID=A0A7Y9ZAT8_9MICO|nr:ABC transporter permease subunit [Demequina lutea]NYI41977.1 ABC-type proline/glycine betaine transport system permease subunit [Demequina lutea]
MEFRIHFGDWITSGLVWVENNLGWFFGFLKDVYLGLYHALNWLFTTPTPLVVIVALGLLAFLARGWKFGLGAAAGLVFILGVNQWENAMDSLSLVIVAALFAILISIPLGIWAAQNSVVSKILKPIMDFLQTMPALVYLLPAIALFHIGVAPGIFATVLFALAPGVRLTELGIRGVDKEVVEAGQAFGASPSRILRQIQLPLAMPSIMAGINQIIMLSLSMVVIAGFVGAGGLGGQVVKSLSALDKPLGFESGMAVVILAIILDRFTGAFGNKRAKSLMGRWFSRFPGGGARPGDTTAGKGVDQIKAENRAVKQSGLA